MTFIPPKPFWRTTPLEQMSPQQWESLCDGCARCCLIKLEDEDTGEICTTSVACRYLDLERCRCTQYAERTTLVPTCVRLTPENLPEQFHYMPQSCAYRLVHEGRGLPTWHPLVTGNHTAMEEMGIGVHHIAISETEVMNEEDLFEHILDCDGDL